jgi:hypothetical protein
MNIEVWLLVHLFLVPCSSVPYLPCMKSKHLHRIIFILVLVSTAGYLRAQSKSYKVEEQKDIYYQPTNQKGAAGTIAVKIVYDVFFGDPTIKAMAGKFRYGDYFYYNNQRYAFSSLPEEIRKKFRLSLTDVCYDISDGSKVIVSNVCKKNLMDWDMAGSPNWSDVFPGLSAQQAKEVFKKGFSITNIRISGASFNYPSDLSKYITAAGIYNGPGNNNTGSTDLPATDTWEAVKYFRKGDSVFILHNNGTLESIYACGTASSGNQNGGQSGNTGNGTGTGNSSSVTEKKLLSPFYNGNTIVWGEKQTNNRWKILDRNATRFREASESEYNAMKAESILTADKMDGDWDEIVNGAGRGRLTPKYPTLPVNDPGDAVRQMRRPDYPRMIVLRVYDGNRYADGIKQTDGKWMFMESNAVVFSVDEKTFRDMISRQRTDIRY